MSVLELLTHGDGVSRSVAALLLAMSVSSWVVILWKGWLLRGGTRDVLRSIAAFWQSTSLTEAEQRLQAFDRSALVLPTVAALRQVAASRTQDAATLGAAGDRNQRLTRVLREALHGALRRLRCTRSCRPQACEGPRQHPRRRRRPFAVRGLRRLGLGRP